MPRLFIGLELPARIKEQLLTAQDGVAGARWQTKDQLHLTLRFIGSVDEQRMDDLSGVLADLDFDPFDISVSGTGCFGPVEQPRIIWAGVAPAPPLLALHNLLNQRLTRVGIEPEERPYRPHITMARCRPDTGSCAAYLSEHENLLSPPFRVERVCLFLSTPGPHGSRYQIVNRFPGDG